MGRHNSYAVPAVVMLAGAVIALGLSLGAGSSQAMSHGQPFGSDEDVAFANKVWKAMDGYMAWPMRSGVYEGTSPHGAFLRMYYNLVNVDGDAYHVIVKDNYGGEGATQAKVESDPGAWLAAVTIMVQREDGYDPDNDNWFWVKYKPDGTIEANAEGMAMAGRVAKGADKGCIACHAKAGGGDYLFSNDHSEMAHKH